MVKLRLSSGGAKKQRKEKSIVLSLHQDLILRVAMQVAAGSSNPLEDVRSLRASCKSFWRASKEKLVGRSLAVDKESKMQWWEKDAYLALLQNCADCDNLNANFILGVEELCNLNRASSGLQHLHRAMDGGHLNAAYFMGMVLFRHAGTRSDAMEILNRVASGDLSSRCNVTECRRSGNPVIERCRRETIEEVQKGWKRGLEMEPRVPCKHRHCGRADDDRSGDGWVRDDQRPRAFCGQVCRWAYECHLFFRNI